MILKDLLTIVIIFMIILTIGINIVEERVNLSLGLDVKPKSFYFFISDDRKYEFCIMGHHYMFEGLHKVGEIHAGKTFIDIEVADKKISFSPLIDTRLNPKHWLNLDK
jgi:hypothetical protein